MGTYDSSITRVWPVFRQLFKNDETGVSWLPKVLRVSTKNRGYAEQIAASIGGLDQKLLETRRHTIGRSEGSSSEAHVECEKCFEWKAPPPEAFLRWLIKNPDEMTWPENGDQGWKPETREWREKLCGRRGPQDRAGAMQMADQALTKFGAAGSDKKWWAFEGFTYVDCYLETDDLVLFIEGKRTERQPSKKTNWYPARNQLIRNLEAAKEASGGKSYALVLIADETMELSPEDIKNSLPHMTEHERNDLMSHYLGGVPWKQMCEATGIDYEGLPDTVSEASKRMADGKL